MIEERDNLSDGVSAVQNPGERPILGYGYVILSRQMSRADYIEKAFRNNLLTIITDKNEIIRDCYVTEGAWKYIKFPKTIKTKGSCVMWICAPGSNKTTILATVTKRDELQQVNTENSFKLIRETELGTVMIEGKADNGTLNFIVDSETEGGAQVTLRILNSLTQGLFDIYVQGNLNLEVDDTVNLKIGKALNVRFIDEFNNSKFTDISYVLGEGYTINDEFGNNIKVNADGITATVPSKKLIIFKGENGKVQTALLGQNVEKVLNKLSEVVSGLQGGLATASALPAYGLFAASLGTSLPGVATKINSLAGLISAIQSKNVKLS